MSRTRVLFATWFGAGFSPLVPGTVGTLGAVPLVLALWWRGSWVLHLAAVAAVTGLGLWAATGAEEHWRRKDPGHVVIDEVAGYLVATFLVRPGLAALAISFVLFRLLDIVKPWPARQLERLPGQWGIMTDDLVAGLYANLLLAAGAWFWPRALL